MAHSVDGILHIAKEKKRHVFFRVWIRHLKIIPRRFLPVGHSSIAIAHSVLQLFETRHIIGGFATARSKYFSFGFHTKRLRRTFGLHFEVSFTHHRVAHPTHIARHFSIITKGEQHACGMGTRHIRSFRRIAKPNFPTHNGEYDDSHQECGKTAQCYFLFQRHWFPVFTFALPLGRLSYSTYTIGG